MPAAIQVGQPYVPSKTQWDEGCQYNFDKNGHTLELFFAQPTSQDINAVKSGQARFGLLKATACIFLLFKLGNLAWSDAPYNWHMVPQDRRQATPVLAEGQTALLSIILVNADSGIVEAIRAVALPRDFSIALHNAIEAQTRSPVERAFYDLAVSAAYARHPTTMDMVSDASTVIA